MTKGRGDQVVWLSESTENRYNSIVESRHLVVFPWLVESVLARTPSTVLDYGAGDGKFLLSLRESFEGELWYYDPSQILQKRARSYLRQKRVQFCTSPQSMRPESIDIIVSTAVWMTINTHNGCVQYLTSQFRILKPGGCALVAVTHPCFREEKYSSFYSNFSNDFYLRDGFPFEVSIFDEESEVKVLDYHWNLSTMLHQASEAGFRLISLSELPDTDKGGGRGAPWLCFEFRKD